MTQVQFWQLMGFYGCAFTWLVSSFYYHLKLRSVVRDSEAKLRDARRESVSPQAVSSVSREARKADFKRRHEIL